MTKKRYICPPYRTAVRNFAYKPHWNYLYRRGKQKVNRIKSREYRTSNNFNLTKTKIINAGRPDDLPIMPIAGTPGDGYINAHYMTHFKHKYLGPVPWFVDPSSVFERNRYDLPFLIYDLIHMLIYREPPPGPFFFNATPDNSSFKLLVNFHAVYDHRYAPHDQPYPQATPSGSLLHQLPCAYQIHKLCWFNPHNPSIRWCPETYSWVSYYNHPLLPKPYRNRHGAWAYWRACQAMEEHLIVKHGLSDADIDPQTFAALTVYDQYIPKGVLEGNRFFARFSPDFHDLQHTHRIDTTELSEKTLRNKAEHPCMPLWIAAIEEKRSVLSADDDFADLLSL